MQQLATRLVCTNYAGNFEKIQEKEKRNPEILT